jgi:hypothetical protein
MSLRRFPSTETEMVIEQNVKWKERLGLLFFIRERAAVSVAIAKMGTAIRIAIKDHYQVCNMSFWAQS